MQFIITRNLQNSNHRQIQGNSPDASAMRAMQGLRRFAISTCRIVTKLVDISTAAPFELRSAASLPFLCQGSNIHIILRQRDRSIVTRKFVEQLEGMYIPLGPLKPASMTTPLGFSAATVVDARSIAQVLNDLGGAGNVPDGILIAAGHETYAFARLRALGNLL